jgi:serine/threonine protein kinase
MLQKCEHRNILRYEDFAYSGRPWEDPNAKLYTEYCQQGDLLQFTATVDGPNLRLNIEQGIQVFSQIAQALLYIHHGISLTLEGMPYMAEIHVPGVNGTRTQYSDWERILHRDIKPHNGQLQSLVASGHDTDRGCSVHRPAIGSRHPCQTWRF